MSCLSRQGARDREFRTEVQHATAVQAGGLQPRRAARAQPADVSQEETPQDTHGSLKTIICILS